MILHVDINRRQAVYRKRDGYIVCDNKDYEIEFAFDSDWDAHTKKTARFIWNGRHENVDFEGNTCPVPQIVNTHELKVGVYAGDLKTTTSATIPCLPSVLDDSSAPGGIPMLNGDSTFIRYSHFPDGTDFTEKWSMGQHYIGIATGQNAPADKSAYEWSFFVGDTVTTYYTVMIPSATDSDLRGWHEYAGRYELQIMDLAWMKEDLFVELKCENSEVFTEHNLALYPDNGFLDLSIDSLPDRPAVLYILVPNMINGGLLNGGAS